MTLQNYPKRYSSIRKQTEFICGPLIPEDYVVQPIVDVSPPKWHLAHTTWFFENFVLVPNMKGYQLYNKDYGFLFNSYYETVGERVLRPNRGNLTRPGVEEVYQYRTYVDKYMQEYLASEVSMDVLNVLEIGLQHEQQHQELLMYDIKYILGRNPIFPIYQKTTGNGVETSSAKKASFAELTEGVYEIGHNGAGFSFDNELGRHKVYVHPYRMMDRLVTNKEYLEFMEDGGYSQFQYWLSEAWEWVSSEKPNAPFHWHVIDGEWHQYELAGGLVKVDMNAPVYHVSYYEADAYARWKGKRLPTEFEWEVATQVGMLNNRNVANLRDKWNLKTMPQVDNDTQMLGDVWEWTSSAYSPYPKFSIADGALGEYNGKFMSNQMVLRGGSFATPSDHIRTTYRNFFYPHLRWLFSGIRLAESI